MTESPGAGADQSAALLLRLFETERGALVGYLGRLARGVDPACTGEDLAQDVFLRAWARRPAVFDGGYGGARRWLYRLASNWAIDHARHRALRPMVGLSGLEAFAPWLAEGALADPDPAVDAERVALAREQVRGVGRALDGATPGERDALGFYMSKWLAGGGPRQSSSVKSGLLRCRLRLHAARAAEGW